jgi:hypothetical protein
VVTDLGYLAPHTIPSTVVNPENQKLSYISSLARPSLALLAASILRDETCVQNLSGLKYDRRASSELVSKSHIERLRRLRDEFELGYARRIGPARSRKLIRAALGI